MVDTIVETEAVETIVETSIGAVRVWAEDGQYFETSLNCPSVDIRTVEYGAWNEVPPPGFPPYLEVTMMQ